MILRHYEWMIALRFLFKGRLQTILIIAGIAAGVAVQFFLSSLIAGLQISLVDRTVGTAVHIEVLPLDTFPKKITENSDLTFSSKIKYKENKEILSWQQYIQPLKNYPKIKAVTASARGQVLLENGGVSYSVTLKGIQFPDGAQMYNFKKTLRAM